MCEEKSEKQEAKKIIFRRAIAKQGGSYVIVIPRPFYLMLKEWGFIGRKLRVILEKVEDEEGEGGEGYIMTDKIVFIAKISKAGKNHLIHIPKALIPYLRSKGFFNSKLKVILEKD